jgi:methionyl-tRNA synthetase
MHPFPVYVTTSIPYVNAPPHLGHALEFVLADSLARYHRLAGHSTRLQSGTDDNSLKNVLAAERQGLPVEVLVGRNARAFRRLLESLEVATDGFIQTSTEPGHAKGAAALWEAARTRGDLYRRSYRGLYCTGCEQFYTAAELEAGLCPEHLSPPELVDEENWFFRLSRYQEALVRLIRDGRLLVLPEGRRQEALAFLESGLHDFSISRSRKRARGWGIPVPGDAEQVMYVWFDALASYITALGYPSPEEAYQTFWAGEGFRLHGIGKGILRFHAVYWPALLLSAGLPPPSAILVHGYLTVSGEKMGKTRGNVVDPVEVADRVGADRLRYWLLRAVPQGEDTDWSWERVGTLGDGDLADGLGNLLQRTVSMLGRYEAAGLPGAPPSPGSVLGAAVAGLGGRLERAMAQELDPRAALEAVWELVRAANRHANQAAPWRLAREWQSGRASRSELEIVLGELAETLRVIAEALRPFLPLTAARVAGQLGVVLSEGNWPAALEWGYPARRTSPLRLQPLFPKAPRGQRAGGSGAPPD